MIDPTTMFEYSFVNQQKYLLIDMEAPEVQSSKVRSIARANLTVYEQMVRKYFSGDFVYDMSEVHQPERRTIKFLDTIAGVITPPSYLLVLIILEF